MVGGMVLLSGEIRMVQSFFELCRTEMSGWEGGQAAEDGQRRWLRHGPFDFDALEQCIAVNHEVRNEDRRNDDRRGDDRRDSVDSLDTLSVDIARMIDHEAAVDLWERYRRGERGVFTRRLYTIQGQKAFDEIRGKYRSDPEFRQTVEHYIHEFERLLDDAARSDRGPAMVRSYLTSDTGKVYTMLAHAAGRLDQ